MFVMTIGAAIAMIIIGRYERYTAISPYEQERLRAEELRQIGIRERAEREAKKNES